MTPDIAPRSDHAPDALASHAVYAVLNYLRILRLRQRVMLAAVVSAALLGGLYYATATRYYDAEACLLILQIGGDVLAPSMGVEGEKQEVISTCCQLLKSAVVLQGAMEKLSPKHRIDFEGVPADKRLKVLELNLAASSLRRTNIIQLNYRSKHPAAAMAVVYGVIQSYFDFLDRTHRGTAGEIMQVLAREKVQLEQKLEKRETELLEARRTFGDLGIKPGGNVVHPLVQRAVHLNGALMEAQEKRLEVQSTLASIEAALRNGEDLQQYILAVEAAVGREILLAGLGFHTHDATVQSNLEHSLLEDRSERKTMTQYYGPAHPRLSEVDDRIRATEQYLVAYQSRINQRLNQMKNTQLGPMLTQMLRQTLTKAWQQESALRASYETARLEAVRFNGNLAQLEIVEHDVERLRAFHDVLVNQIANTDLRQEHGDIRATVVKEPTSSASPVSPRLAVVASACMVVALVVGGASVYVLDVLDDRFRSPDEVKLRLGVPVLALVRRLPSAGQNGLAGVQTYKAPDAVESEAFRTLRTALAFSPHETERMVISSAEPGDGKSTVLVNLAVSCAQSGKRTLLVDADLRRPGLTNLLGLKGEPGVTDCLRCDEALGAFVEQCVLRTEVERLDVLASGPRRPNPSEQLASSRFADLLVWAESQYDQVLIDSPPVLAASDAQILGRLADGVILVMDWQKNRRRVMASAVESMTSLGVRVMGVVANRFSTDLSSDYAYSYTYAYEENSTDEDRSAGTDRLVAESTGADQGEDVAAALRALSGRPAVDKRVA